MVVSCHLGHPHLTTGSESLGESELEREYEGLVDKIDEGGPLKKSKEAAIVCADCGRVFKKVAKLTRHRRSHTGEKVSQIILSYVANMASHTA